MKLLPRIFWEKPGEKEKFQEIMNSDDSTIVKISRISRAFSISLSDAQEATQVYNELIKK